MASPSFIIQSKRLSLIIHSQPCNSFLVYMLGDSYNTTTTNV